MNHSPEKDRTFEQALTELERIVRELEDGQIGLEESLAHYEHGIGLLKHCYAILQQAEQRILLLTGVDEQGQPLTQPFTHVAAVDADKKDTKRRKKNGDGEELF
ncbi:MAG: exodeoxyribonuclease VII small subunit [Gemmataceae bacterium]